jgi:hypothetical protein
MAVAVQLQFGAGGSIEAHSVEGDVTTPVRRSEEDR